MTGLTSRRFQMDDYGKIDPVEGGVALFEGDTSLELFHPEQLIRTLSLEGEPVALVGITQMWPGVGRVWAWMEDGARQHILSFTKIAKRELLPEAFRAGFVRLEAEVAVTDEAAINWIEVLGFHLEATLCNRGLDGVGDQHLYVRFRSDG